MSNNTDLALINAQLPAHLQGNAAEVAKKNAAAAGGIKLGGFPRISLAGGKFHVVDDGEKRLISDPSDPTLPLMRLQAVVAAWSPHVMKTYYPNDYDSDEDQKEPVCRSDDGVTPDADVANPQAKSCATCPQNAWGSKVSKYSGKDVKACTDGKRIVLLPAEDLGSKPLALNITPAALKEWAKYVNMLSQKGVELDAVVTGFTFDPEANFPRLMFKFVRFLEADEYDKVKKRQEGQDVQAIVRPREVISIRELPAPEVEAPAAAKPEAPAAPGQDLSHIPAEIRATIDVVGADSPAGKALIAQFPAPAPAPVAEEVPAEPVDPYINVPDAARPAMRAACEAVGGPDTEAGQSILAAFKPAEVKEEPKPKEEPKEEPKPKTKSKSKAKAKAKEEDAAPAAPKAPTAPAAPKAPAAPAAPAAPKAPAAPAAPAAGYATSEQAGQDLNALLGQAMGKA